MSRDSRNKVVCLTGRIRQDLHAHTYYRHGLHLSQWRTIKTNTYKHTYRHAHAFVFTRRACPEYTHSTALLPSHTHHSGPGFGGARLGGSTGAGVPSGTTQWTSDSRSSGGQSPGPLSFPPCPCRHPRPCRRPARPPSSPGASHRPSPAGRRRCPPRRSCQWRCLRAGRGRHGDG